ncbi:MAG: hypothetical protein INH41_16065 [Myxococcaceae bacterium]|jgi:hypothetical protein|nr:hypothetical protein [Myxococcaceae bacterium]MCA3013896.1 hypothetical protein [Myxococcaceae bacterium]
MAPPRRRSSVARRGQVMVLSVVTMLMLALMMMVGFNVAHTAHERIRIQAAADAQAYSVAVMQARAFNVNAVINRTIAALTVAQMSLHAWNVIATHNVDMLFAGFISFLGVAATEAGQCPPYYIGHCIDAAEAIVIAFEYLNNHHDYEDRLKRLQPAFNEAVRELYEAKKSLYDQELRWVRDIDRAIDGGSMLTSLLQQSAPQAKYVQAFHLINAQNFRCAVSGPEGDVPRCGGSAPLVYARSDVTPAARSVMMENASNAARGLFNRLGGGGAMVSHSIFQGQTPVSVTNPSKMMDIQGSGLFQAAYLPDPSAMPFTTRVGDTTYDKRSSSSEEARNVGGATGPGGVAVQWRHGFGGMFLGSSVFSSLGGGEHTRFASERHGEFKTIARQPDEATFITFRAHLNPSQDNEWGQPSGYGAVTQDLRLLQKGGRGAFEVNRQGTIIVRIGTMEHRVRLVSENEGVAVSKAKAYFHQFGASWQLPPNGFDPFWFAKLHPFRRDELRAALALAGDPNAAVMGPVEGREGEWP